MSAHPSLTPRQRKALDLLVHVHQEFGLGASVTHEAMHLLTDAWWAGSLSRLVQYGLVERVSGNDGIGYRMTEHGWAEFAGVPLELA
jgi:hypothetical protein